MTFTMKYSYLLYFLFLLLACDTGPMVYSDTDEFLGQLEYQVIYKKSLGHLITRDILILTPTGYTPLAAELKLETTQPVQVELEIESLHENEEHLIHRFNETATSLHSQSLGSTHRTAISFIFASMTVGINCWEEKPASLILQNSYQNSHPLMFM